MKPPGSRKGGLSRRFRRRLAAQKRRRRLGDLQTEALDNLGDKIKKDFEAVLNAKHRENAKNEKFIKKTYQDILDECKRLEAKGYSRLKTIDDQVKTLVENNSDYKLIVGKAKDLNINDWFQKVITKMEEKQQEVVAKKEEKQQDGEAHENPKDSTGINDLLTVGDQECVFIKQSHQKFWWIAYIVRRTIPIDYLKTKIGTGSATVYDTLKAKPEKYKTEILKPILSALDTCKATGSTNKNNKVFDHNSIGHKKQKEMADHHSNLNRICFKNSKFQHLTTNTKGELTPDDTEKRNILELRELMVFLRDDMDVHKTLRDYRSKLPAKEKKQIASITKVLEMFCRTGCKCKASDTGGMEISLPANNAGR